MSCLSIVDVVQYEGLVELTNDFFYSSQTEQRLSQVNELIDQVSMISCDISGIQLVQINGYLSGSTLANDTQFFTVQLLQENNVIR